MSTEPSQPDDAGPELQSLEADESIPPRPEEEAANAVDLPHRDSEQRTHPDDVVGAFSALTEESASAHRGRDREVAQSLYRDHGPEADAPTAQPYPPSPAPTEGGPDAPSADLADPDYSPPDYPDDVERTGGQG